MTREELNDIIGRFERSSLTRLRFAENGLELELAREAGMPAAAPSGTPATEAGPEAACQETTVDAPLVGCFYAAPAPGQPPYVTVGDRVKKGQTLCLIEAMKMMSEIPAPCDCLIEAVLKQDGQLAGYHEPLFRYRAV